MSLRHVFFGNVVAVEDFRRQRPERRRDVNLEYARVLTVELDPEHHQGVIEGHDST
jgi:hypothetical protein